MILDLGDYAPLSISVYDNTGALANAGAVTCTITLPDGTTTTPSVTNPSTGVYNCDYLPTLAGRYSVRWVATGVNASATTDEITVRDPNNVGIVGLDEVKAYLNIDATDTSDDEELRRFMDDAHAQAENYKGMVFGRRTFVDTFDGYAQTTLRVRNPNIISVTSITENGVALTQGTDFYVDFSGQFIYRLRNSSTGAYPIVTSYWLPGVQNIVVTYVAGNTSPDARGAILALIAWSWQTQRGAFDVMGRTVDSNPANRGLPGYGLPYFVTQKLDGINAPGGFA